MRLGSINNEFAGSSAAPAPGVGITVCHWTDREAGTVERVSESGKALWFRADTAKRTDAHGMSESQAYSYERNPDAPLRQARLTKRGWREVRGSKVVVGYRDAYHDYSF